MINVKIKRLAHGKDLPLPLPQTKGAAAADLYAALPKAVTLAPREHKIIPTGFAMALPVGYEAQIRPRSGLAAKQGITVLNSPGTIDCDYRGEIGVILINLSSSNFIVQPAMRVAQMLIMPVYLWQWQEVEDLEKTSRNRGGFGSTGININKE